MPPKARITNEMIIDAAFDIIKAEGIGMVNARNIAKRLNCSTQPILYYFSGMEEIKNAAYKKADDYHSSFIMDIQGEYPNPLLEMGMRYIRFAATEKELFKFLFQSDKFDDKDLAEIIGSEELMPVLQMFSHSMKLPLGQAKDLFERLFFAVHGIASLLANNRATFDEGHIQSLLKGSLVSGMISIERKGEET